MDDVKLNDFANICRCCLAGATEFNHIFMSSTNSTCNDDKTYAQMVTTCTDLEIHIDDEFSHLICYPCTIQLCNSYSFRQMCQRSAYSLAQIKNTHLPVVNGEISNLPQFIGCSGDSKHDDAMGIDSGVERKISDHNELAEEENVAAADDFRDISENSEDEKSTKITRKNKNQTGVSEDEMSIMELCKSLKRKKSKKDVTKETLKKRTAIKPVKYGRKKVEPQICPICGVIRNNLSQHMATHSEDKPCKCDICGISVKTSSTLRKHMVRVHTEHRPYQCDICKMALKTATHLKRHTLTHTRERNFTCSYCGKTFIDAGTRDRHQWRHNAERRIKCQYCDKLFLTQKGLLNHVGIHTGELPFKCGLCPKAFVNSQAASIHRRSHTVDNYFQCGTCEMRFKLLTLLKIHIKVEKHSLSSTEQN